MPKHTLPKDKIISQQIKNHYDIERKLADRLRCSTKNERAKLYTSLYDELFRRIPYHPQLQNKLDPHDREVAVNKSLRLVRALLRPDTVFLEIGAGDCAFSIEVSRTVKHVYSVDVSEEIAKRKTMPENVDVIISDGTSIDIPHNYVNIAYSNQLMEHLHPEDALEQLQNIYDVLAPSGKYFCITPNRLTGPHDVSAYFDDTATGFHLKEYTNQELYEMFLRVGFTRVDAYVGKRGIYVKFPLKWKIAVEKFINILPYRIKRFLTKSVPIRILLRIIIVGTK